MRVESGFLKDDLTVSEPFTLHGLAAGNVTVVSGGTLTLNGLIRKNLTVDAGAFAKVLGLVAGDVVNKGGMVEVRGMIAGGLRNAGGTNRVAKTAVITGAVVGETTPIA